MHTVGINLGNAKSPNQNWQSEKLGKLDYGAAKNRANAIKCAARCSESMQMLGHIVVSAAIN